MRDPYENISSKNREDIKSLLLQINRFNKNRILNFQTLNDETTSLITLDNNIKNVLIIERMLNYVSVEMLFIIACETDNIYMANILANSFDVDINTSDQGFLMAIYYSSFKIVNMFLSRGYNVNKIFSSSYKDLVNIVWPIDPITHRRVTPYLLSEKMEYEKILYGVIKFNALLLAIKFGYLDIVRLLIDKGIDITFDKNIAIRESIVKGYVPITLLLIEKNPEYGTPEYIYQWLILSCRYESFSIWPSLIEMLPYLDISRIGWECIKTIILHREWKTLSLLIPYIDQWSFKSEDITDNVIKAICHSPPDIIIKFYNLVKEKVNRQNIMMGLLEQCRYDVFKMFILKSDKEKEKEKEKDKEKDKEKKNIEKTFEITSKDVYLVNTIIRYPCLDSIDMISYLVKNYDIPLYSDEISPLDYLEIKDLDKYMKISLYSSSPGEWVIHEKNIDMLKKLDHIDKIKVTPIMIHRSVYNNDISMIKYLYTLHPDITINHDYSLMIACYNGNYDMVSWLLQSGAYSYSRFGEAVKIACMKGYQRVLYSLLLDILNEL